LDKEYPNKKEVKEIKLEKGIVVTGQLQIEYFPYLERIGLSGN